MSVFGVASGLTVFFVLVGVDRTVPKLGILGFAPVPTGAALARAPFVLWPPPKRTFFGSFIVGLAEFCCFDLGAVAPAFCRCLLRDARTVYPGFHGFVPGCFRKYDQRVE